MTRALALLASAVLLAGCATTPRASAPPPGEPEPLPAGSWVELRFGWPAGLAADVAVVHARTAPGAGAPVRQEIRVDARLAVVAEEDGVSVRTTDLRYRGVDQPTPTGVELLAEELPAPELHVGAGGALRTVEPRDGAADQLVGALVTLSHVSPIPGSFREAILARGDGPALVADARAAWDRLVGFWAGASLEVGRTYAARDLIAVDLLADLPLEAVVRMRVQGRVACTPEETARRCVALELQVAPDEAAITGVIPLLAQLFGESDQPARLAYEERTLLIAEPEGLVPHRLSTVRTVAVAFGPGGADHYERRDERTATFRYAAPAPAAAASPSAGTRSSSQQAVSSR